MVQVIPLITTLIPLVTTIVGEGDEMNTKQDSILPIDVDPFPKLNKDCYNVQRQIK